VHHVAHLEPRLGRLRCVRVEVANRHAV
jgi:hypothetical protein